MATLPADSFTAYEWCLKETIAPNGEIHIATSIIITMFTNLEYIPYVYIYIYMYVCVCSFICTDTYIAVINRCCAIPITKSTKVAIASYIPSRKF